MVVGQLSGPLHLSYILGIFMPLFDSSSEERWGMWGERVEGLHPANSLSGQELNQALVAQGIYVYIYEFSLPL